MNEKKGELAQNGRLKKENKTLLEIYLDVDNSDLDTKDVIGININIKQFCVKFSHLFPLARSN